MPARTVEWKMEDDEEHVGMPVCPQAAGADWGVQSLNTQAGRQARLS